MQSDRQQARAMHAGSSFFDHILKPMLWFLLGMAGKTWWYLGQLARVNAAQYRFADGVSPASAQTTDLPQSQLNYYDKSFVESLKPATPWLRATSRRTLPEKSGNSYVLFMYGNLPGNTQQAAEGTIGMGLTPSVSSNSSKLGQYADYMNFSDRVQATSIDPVLDNGAQIMALRMALSINTISQATADIAGLIDPNVAKLSKTSASLPLTTVDIRTAIQSLAGKDIPPFDGMWYTGIIHNFLVGDVLNDNSAGSLSDVLKRSPQGAEQLKELPSATGDADNIPVLEWAGCRFMPSNQVKQTPNYLGSGKTALRTYIMGQDGVITIDLGSTNFTAIKDGRRRNLQMWVRSITEPSGYDPSRLIGGFVSYNYLMTNTLPPDTTQRIRYIDAVPVVS